MFHKLAARLRPTSPPRHYRQRVEPEARQQSPTDPVYVTLRQRTGQQVRDMEHVQCEYRLAELMGHTLWKAFVDESVGLDVLDYEVIIRSNCHPVRRRCA